MAVRGERPRTVSTSFHRLLEEKGIPAALDLNGAAMPAAGEDQVRMGWPEIMTLPLGDPGNRDWPAQLPDALRQRLHQCRALVIGPGMGRGEDSHAFLAALLKEPGRPACVFDADALMLLAEDPALLAALGPGDILTPHPGEAAALLHCPGGTVQQDRMAALNALCAIVPSAVVLKGAGTLVGQRDCPTGLSPLDVPQLAMGGSGDVLAGCAAALLARLQESPRSAHQAACLAVALHAAAGGILARTHPRRGNVAGELADALPQAMTL